MDRQAEGNRGNDAEYIKKLSLIHKATINQQRKFSN